jgi:hypothetical protein
MKPYEELSMTAQTMYAQLLDAAVAAEHARSVANLTGSFASKTVKGKKYYYFQYTEPSGKLHQIYVGPESPAVISLVEQKAKNESSKNALSVLARSAMALGCAEVLPRHFRVIRRLAEYGFFRAGGVLIGTHAFLAFGNMLGVRWGDRSRTQDIDFAHAGKNLAIALPANVEVETHEAIQSLEMGFLPISGLASKSGATYLNPKEPDFRLDFLTTLHRGGEEPYEHPQLHVTLQPLKFMEFSLEHVQQAVLFSSEGAVVVNVPHPARYALHKLIVYGERSGTFAVKSNKDLIQAACLLAYLKENRAWEVEEAWADLVGRGTGWVARAARGLAALDQYKPELGIGKWLRKAE